MGAQSHLIWMFSEALESAMSDDMKIGMKRRISTRSGKGNQLLNIKTAVERPILKIGIPNFEFLFYLTSYCIPHFRVIFMTSHMTPSSALRFCTNVYFHHYFYICLLRWHGFVILERYSRQTEFWWQRNQEDGQLKLWISGTSIISSL